MTIELSKPPSTFETARLAEVFRALGDPTRLAIYELVRAVSPEVGHTGADIANTVTEIAKRFDLSLSTVSHHLKELRRAGLIRCERRGQFVYCSTDRAVLGDLEGFLATERTASRGR